MIFKDRVLESTTTTGTGTLTLAGALTGFQSFAAIGDGNTCFYSLWAVDGDGVPTGDWEVGIGTYTASGTTLSRDTILASSNGGSAVNLGAGTKQVAVCDPAAKVGLPDVQTFTANGTWTKPTGCRASYVICIGGGGGGGSGRRGAASTARSGGGGGAGGRAANAVFPSDQLSSTESVTIGAGGSGGAAISANDTSGNAGTDGGDTTFGSSLHAEGGAAGTGGTATVSSGGITSTPDYMIQNPVGAGAITQGSGGNASPFGAGTGSSGLPSAIGGGGGGGGGSITSSNGEGAGGSGGVGGTYRSQSGGGAGGTTSGGAGGAGGSVSTDAPFGGSGGGGGGANTTGAGGAGGDGGTYGGGGGGGGASLNGSNSGAGGDGVDGICVVISW